VQYQVQVIDNIGIVAIERNFNGDCWQTGQGTIWCFNASFIYKLASKRLQSTQMNMHQTRRTTTGPRLKL
jgi:hypothetical protein